MQKMSFFFVSMTLALYSSSPLFCACMIVLMAGTVGFLSGFFMSKWMFILMFMVFLGGMMILFFYVLSLAKPVKSYFFFNVPQIILFLLLSTSLLLYESHSVISIWLLNELYNKVAAQTMVFLAFILFVCLFATVKVTENFKGSLLSAW